eukprot:COSAG06_NODE_58462_length_277_cov_0.573034_1_plen_47_part_00
MVVAGEVKAYGELEDEVLAMVEELCGYDVAFIFTVRVVNESEKTVN